MKEEITAIYFTRSLYGNIQSILSTINEIFFVRFFEPKCEMSDEITLADENLMKRVRNTFNNLGGPPKVL